MDILLYYYSSPSQFRAVVFFSLKELYGVEKGRVERPELRKRFNNNNDGTNSPQPAPKKRKTEKQPPSLSLSLSLSHKQTNAHRESLFYFLIWKSAPHILYYSSFLSSLCVCLFLAHFHIQVSKGTSKQLKVITKFWNPCFLHFYKQKFVIIFFF